MTVSNHARLLQQLRRWEGFPRSVLLYIDVRHMRSINRLADGAVGDALLARVLKTLRDWAGPHGIAERLWSNEFVAVKAIDHAQAAIDEATRLRQALTSLHYPSLLGESPIAVAIGLTLTAPRTQWQRALSEAAEACQTAKHRGLNQIVHSTPAAAMAADSVNALHVTEFRQMLASHRLRLHPQPIMDIRGPRPRLRKAEFLIRGEQSGRILPLPMGTIDSLEYFGLSTELDAFTAQTALDWIQEHPEALQRLDGVSINLSAQSIQDGHFMEKLLRDVSLLKLPRGKLCFEITERTAIAHLAAVADLIDAFRRIGCRFSLDDFGSGLCSFGYLQSLPVDEVKIDGRFIQDAMDNAASVEIIRAIHQVAKATGKKTVAEFVDDPRKLALLQQIGVDYAQGWLFHPAVGVEEFVRLIWAEADEEPIQAASAF